MPDTVNDMRARAESGDTGAMIQLSDWYFMGLEGLEHSPDLAFEWLLKAAEKGDAAAQNAAGTCYELGQPVAQDMKKAAEWYLKAFQGGDADACLSLALLYDEGKFFQHDNQFAVAFYEEGALRGSPMCKHRLAMKYLDGHGVPQNTVHAMDLLDQAGSGGRAGAYETLGTLYLMGDVVPRNPEMAYECFSRGVGYFEADPAVALGDLPVLFALCLITGTGCQKNAKLGTGVLERAAEAGNPVAQEILKDLTVRDPLIQLWFLGREAADVDVEKGWDLSGMLASKFA